MTTKKRVEETPGEPNPDIVNDEPGADGVMDTVAGPVSIDQGPEEPQDQEPAEDRRAVTMGDVAALNGIGVAPDASRVETVNASDLPFMSAGMASDLEHYGWAVDPLTGRKVVKGQ